MELTQKTFISRLEALQKILREDHDELNRLGASLHEKGVECSIIVPMLETLLEFDSLRDISYEQESTQKHGQRFDFLLEGRLLVEAKALGANLDEHRRQISKYISTNDEINYGLLSNGVDYQIWLQRSFIEKVAETKMPHTEVVAKVLEFNMEEDGVAFFADAMSIFKKDSYDESFKTIARIAGKVARGGGGKWPVLHMDKKMNETLRERIREEVNVTTGIYYDDIKNNKRAAGDLLTYKGDGVEITVELTDKGTVKLKKGSANIVDMVAAINDGWMPMVTMIAEKWSKAEHEFDDPLEIIKEAKDMQKPARSRYEFVGEG